MIVGALLLALLGSAETCWEHFHRPWVKISFSVISWIAIVAFAVSILGLPLAWALGAVAMASALVLAFRRRRGALASFAILVVAVAFTSSATPVDPAPQVVWAYDVGAQPLSELGLDIEALAVFAALVLFLGDAANTVVKAVLHVAGVSREAPASTTAPESVARRPRFLGGRAPLTTPPPPPPKVFRGGRYIGALERWLVFVLLPLGALPVVVALLAAKGIVRFPEVSKDADGGTSAEYFLVGTLTSFGLALAAAGYLALAL